MKNALPCLTVGAAFGFVLGWAQLTNPDTIYNMLTLRETYVFFIMGSAIGTAFVGTRLLRRFKARTLMGGELVTWTTMPVNRDHVIGSALFGLGWSVANTCPGPIAAMIGRGQWSGLFLAAGLFVGIALRDAHQARARRAAVGGAAQRESTIQPDGAGL